MTEKGFARQIIYFVCLDRNLCLPDEVLTLFTLNGTINI